MDTLGDLLAGCVADPGQVRTGQLDRCALPHDASHCLLLPRAVVVPRDGDEVARLMRVTAAAGVGLTFRSGGTGRSGQADVRRHFTGIEVLDDRARVRVQPRAGGELVPVGPDVPACRPRRTVAVARVDGTGRDGGTRRVGLPCCPTSFVHRRRRMVARTVTRASEVRPVSNIVVPSWVLPGSVTGCAA